MTTMMLASTGGHLAQLHALRPRLVPASEHVVWVTFDSPQSRSLLADEQVEYIPYVAPRQFSVIVRNTLLVPRLLRKHGVTRLFTTGSGIAISFLPIARLKGVECSYIESAARSEGPSVTGRVAALLPGVSTYTQYESSVTSRWKRAVSVFDDFFPAPAEGTARQPIRKVVVSLGTIQGYGFRSLVERLLEVLPSDVEVLWQTGSTDTTGLPIEPHEALPQAELLAAMRDADVVVLHAGIGSALGALTLGKVPVLVPRQMSRGEHVDDHQQQIARDLDGRGLAISREVDELNLIDLEEAAARHVIVLPQEQPV